MKIFIMKTMSQIGTSFSAVSGLLFTAISSSCNQNQHFIESFVKLESD